MWKVAAVAAVALALVPFAGATDGGTLDPAWGTAGKADTRLGGIDDSAQAMVLQPDGKIVVVGTRRSPGLPDRFGRVGSDDWYLVRYLPTGAYEREFGFGGVVAIDLTGRADEAYDLALQPDGKIVFVGSADGVAAVARVDASGARDLSFGDQSLVFLDAGAARSVVTSPGGTIFVGGAAGDRGFVYRLLPNGARDASYRLLADAPVVDLVLTPRGQLLALAQRPNGAIVYRLTADGALDSTWAGDGSLEIVGIARALALQPDGHVLVAAAGALYRFTAAGALDTEFGFRGQVNPGVEPRALAALPDGRIFVAGSAYGDFVVTRLDALGRPDKSWHGDGVATADFGADDGANALVVQMDGKVVAAGGTSRTGNVALARFLPSTCAVPAVVGWREQTASAALVENECTVGTVARAYSPRARGRVLSQSEPRGTMLYDGAPVDLVVSLGPKPKKRR